MPTKPRKQTAPLAPSAPDISGHTEPQLLTTITEDFEALPEQSIGPGGSIETPTMTITYIWEPGLIAIQEMGDPYKPPVNGKVLGLGYVPWKCRIRLDLKMTCSEVRFWHWGHNPITTAYVYSETGLLGVKQLKPSYSEVAQERYSYSRIKRIEFESSDIFLLDHFEFFT